MTYVITGEPSSWGKSVYGPHAEHEYKYPPGLDLRPGSTLHDELRNQIWKRARESRNAICTRFDSWNVIDQTLTAYIPLDDYEESLKKKDTRKPVSIIFPYSYSILESLLTYLTLAFFQEPTFQYEGVEDDDVIGAMLLERIIKMHCIKNKVNLAIHTVLRDSLVYGVGIALPVWLQHYGMRPIKSTVTTKSVLGDNTQQMVDFVEDLLFEGNALDNIDPYMWLPDPSVSSVNTQKGEFVGWVDSNNYMNLLSEEIKPNSTLFNVKYLDNKRNRRSELSLDQSDRQLRYGSNDSRSITTDSVNPVDIIKMYVNLIPKEWNLGDGEYPEKWFFALAADEVMIQAERADHNHGMYPMSIASPEYDGYSATPISRMEILYGLQHTLDFFFNSHITNIRKALNDMLVVDPYLININDLKDPQPGKLIRLRRPAWGRGVDKAVQQLAITDVTRSNISDSMFVTQWMDRISGADQSMQGSLRQGGPDRLTKGEFQGTRGSAISRLERIAMIIGVQFFQDIGTMFAVHTQQYMSKSTYVRAIGRYEEQLIKMFGKRIRVAPGDILVGYDTIVRDGSVPGGNFSESWIRLFEIISGNDSLIKEFDTTKIFSYIAYQMGAKNVEDFKRNVNNIQTSTMSDEDAAAGAAKGDLVPIGSV